jgi:hypothetical protein
MLGSIGDTLGKMGDTGNGYVDTFRRTMAPDLNTDDSKSIMNYAEWARRNGYDDEAKQYLALGYKQKEKEAATVKESRLQEGQAANMYNRQRIADIAADTTLDPAKKRQLISDAMAAQRAVSQAVPGMKSTNWDSGTSALAKVGEQEGASAYSKKLSNMQGVAAELERKADAAPPESKAQFEESLNKLYDRINEFSQTDPSGKGARVGDEMRDARLTRRYAENDDSRADAARSEAAASADRAEVLAPYQLSSAQNQAVTAAYTAQQKADQATGRSMAQSIAVNGVYNPSEIEARYPEASDGQLFEAGIALNTMREQREQQVNATSKGIVSDSRIETAKRLADGGDAQIRALLNQYQKVASQDTTTISNERNSAATALSNALIGKENKALALSSPYTYKAGAVLQQFSELEGSPGLMSGTSYREVLNDDPARFNEMRSGVAEYMERNGIQSIDSYGQLYDIMDEVAPTLADESWRKVGKDLMRERDVAEEEFDNLVDSTLDGFVTARIDEIVADNPVYADYPDETKNKAEQEFEATWKNAKSFFNATATGAANPAGSRLNSVSLKSQQDMRALKSEEWQTIVQYMPDDVVVDIEKRLDAGLSVRFEDIQWAE